jgi:HEPN domain-containing protein
MGLPPIGVAKLALSFAEFAQKDLDASWLLYEHEMYAQAIFLFQQSVEKATKGIGLLLGLTRPQDLRREVGHASVMAMLVRLPERVENLRSNLDAMSKSPATHGAKQELDRLGLGSLDPKELSRRLLDKKTARQQAESVKSLRRDEMWATTLELDSSNPRVVALLKMLDDGETQWKDIDEFATKFEEIAPYLGDPELARYFLNIRGKAFPEVMPLAFVSMWHERETRYPPVETDYWNPNDYKASKGLLKMYPKLHQHAERLCVGAIAGAKAALKM